MHTHGDKSLIGEEAAKINNGNTGFEKGGGQKTKLGKRFQIRFTHNYSIRNRQVCLD